MEKHYEQLTNAAIKSFYHPVIKRTVALLLVNKIVEITDRYDSDQAFVLDFKTGKFAKHLLACLDYIASQRTDILAEVLKQHGIDTNEDSTHYHDRMTIGFEEAVNMVRKLVKANNLPKIYEMSQLSPSEEDSKLILP